MALKLVVSRISNQFGDGFETLSTTIVGGVDLGVRGEAALCAQFVLYLPFMGSA